MKISVVSFKEFNLCVEIAICEMELAIERGKISETKVIKFIHGYGSSGVGGSILIELRKRLKVLKRQKKIREYFSGENWSIINDKARNVFIEFKIEGDDDFNKRNPGITIVVV